MRFLTALVALAGLVLAAPAAEPEFRISPAASFTVLPAAIAPTASDPSASVVYVSRSLGGGTSQGGTGTVIASEDGRSLILTNAHVAEDGNRPLTVTHGKTVYSATFVAGSTVDYTGPNMIRVNGPDLAVLAVNAELPAVTIASDAPVIGARVRLWGYGGRLPSQGFVAKAGNVVPGPNYVEPQMLSTLATINGDSGSGVFNDAGELVGVHHGNDGRAHAVPLDTVRRFVRERSGPWFPRLRERMVARAIMGALTAPRPSAPKAEPALAPKPAAKPPEFVVAPAYSAPSACSGGVCPTYTQPRGRLLRR